MNIVRLLLSLLLLISFTACSSTKEEREEAAQEEEKMEEKKAEAKTALDTYKKKHICPQVAVIRELATVRDFGNEKPDPTQLVGAARMDNISGDCAYQDDGIDITFSISFLAAKGPRLGGERVSFPFFVAVVDPSQAILNKDQMSVPFTFDSDAKTTARKEPLHVFIPLPKDQQAAGPNYRVLAGFQLNEEQLRDVREESKPR